jgi:hypothetical protein
VWATQHDDGDDGRDNAVSELYASDGGDTAASAQVNDLIGKGMLTTVLRIHGYNGSPNDSSVQVELFGASRASGRLNTIPNTPPWDGTAVWNPLVEWTAPAPGPDGGNDKTPLVRSLYESDRAYVSNGELVAHFKSARGATALLFSNVFIQARIEQLTPKPDGGGAPTSWELHGGTFAGRLKMDDLLAAVALVPDPTTGGPTCTDAPSYAAAKKRVCATADIRYGDDDASRPCDAASWAWRFDTGAALLSNNVDQLRSSAFNPCSKETSPSNDRCDTLE